MNAPERPGSFEPREPELPNSLPRPPGELERLKKTWESPRGISFITDVNNTYVGLWYVGTAFLFFILAGILALIMRAQLAVPESDLVGHDLSVYSRETVLMFRRDALAAGYDIALPSRVQPLPQRERTGALS